MELTASRNCRSPSIVTQSPEDVPPIDPRVVDDLQVQANNVAENLRHMMNTLQNHMQKVGGWTVGGRQWGHVVGGGR